MDKTKALDGFKKLVKDLRNEYIDHKGCVTIEFSTSPNNLVEKLDILSKNNVHNHGFGGHWVIFPCETCKGYDEETPLHVMIIDTRSCKDYELIAELHLAKEKITRLTKKLAHKNELLESNIQVDPQDLARVVNIALDAQKERPINSKDDSVIFLSNVVDDYLGTEDERNPLVSDDKVLAKHKEIFRLDSIIKQRTKELELIEGAFSDMIPLDPEALLRLSKNINCESHALIPEHIRDIKHIHELLAKLGNKK